MVDIPVRLAEGDLHRRFDTIRSKWSPKGMLTLFVDVVQAFVSDLLLGQSWRRRLDFLAMTECIQIERAFIRFLRLGNFRRKSAINL